MPLLLRQYERIGRTENRHFEGESLVNDATGLIAFYKYAITAVIREVLFYGKQVSSFYWWLAGYLNRFSSGSGFLLDSSVSGEQSTTDTTFYLHYTICCLPHRWSSACLRCAGGGCGRAFLAWHSHELFLNKHDCKRKAHGALVIFILNGIIFILIGLQCKAVWRNIDGSISDLLFYGAIISLAAPNHRSIIWVYPGAYLPRWMSRKIREKNLKSTFGSSRWWLIWHARHCIISRNDGVAVRVAFGEAFPNRDLIIFITFCVIFSTLVIKGFHYPHLIKWFGIKPDGREHEEEQQIRVQMVSSIIGTHWGQLCFVAWWSTQSSENKIWNRIQRLRKDAPQRKLDNEQINEFHRIQQELLSKERFSLTSLEKKERSALKCCED